MNYSILLNLPESFLLRLHFHHPAENYQQFDKPGDKLHLSWIIRVVFGVQSKGSYFFTYFALYYNKSYKS